MPLSKRCIGTVKRYALTCERCGHGGTPGCKAHGVVRWHVLGDLPEGCACCSSKYWNHPRGTLKRGRPEKKRGE